MKINTNKIIKAVRNRFGYLILLLSVVVWLLLLFGYPLLAFQEVAIILLLTTIYQKIVSLESLENSPSQPTILRKVDVETKLYDMIGKAKTRDRELQVIGMNMEMSWSSIKTKLTEESFHGWKFQFATYVGTKDTADNTKNWRDNSIKNLKSMLNNRESDEVKRRGITIDIYAYTFPPAIHGFRFGNKDLFISTLHRQENGQLSLSNYTYEYISHKDHSPYAIEKRALFDSWWRAASNDQDTVRKVIEGEL